MKFPLIYLILIVIITNCNCELNSSWFPNVLDKFSDKTAAFTNYVKEKGRDFKNNYVKNIRDKISSYFGGGKKEITDERSVTTESDYKQTIAYSRKLPKVTTSTKTTTIKDITLPAFDGFVTKLKRKYREYIVKGERDEFFDENEPSEMKFIHLGEGSDFTKRNAEDDPSNTMTTPQLIALNGYQSESHTVVTEDGYILTVHRIPHAKHKNDSPRNTVLLHHGLLGSSADWIMSGPEKGLAYILSESGYDVWMANVRGNTYSKAHINKDIDSFAFWNFTFHEVSQYDLPAVIDYIMKIKGSDTKIDYIGHSMGTTVLFALLSTKTEYNKILRAGYALAPVAYMSKIRSPIRLFARFSNNLEYLMKLLGANEFLPQNTVLRWLSEHACEINHYEEVICENSLFVVCGHDASEFNKTLLPMILGHTPAGASTKTLIHYAQEIKNDGRFQQFDYGESGNLKQYGQPTPPEYNLDSITLPIALFGSQNDWLASDEDVTKLYVKLKNPIEHYEVPLKEFNHIDFLWAIDAPKLVYAKLLQLLNEVATSNIPFDPNSVETNVLNVP